MMKRYGTWLAALAIAGAAGTAAAQSRKVEGDLDKPMTKQRQKSSGGSGQSVMSMSRTDGDSTVAVRIEDGEVVSATVNGKEVPKDRIRRSEGKVEILDRDGGVIQTFQVGGGHGGTWWFGGEEGFKHLQEIPWGDKPGQFFFTPGEAAAPPKVMLGINMGQPDEETAEKLEVSADETILISKVIEDLPAAKAGLKEGDVVVKIAGKGPATPERLREILKDKEPGDTVKLTVVRDGDEKTLTIELAEYDPSKLGVQALRVEPGEFFGQGQMPGWDEESQKAFEEAMKHWRAAPGAPGERRAFRFEGAPGRGGMVFRAPEGDDRMRERLSELDGRMAEIDRRLSELNERLERLTQTLEKQGSGRP